MQHSGKRISRISEVVLCLVCNLELYYKTYRKAHFKYLKWAMRVWFLGFYAVLASSAGSSKVPSRLPKNSLLASANRSPRLSLYFWNLTTRNENRAAMALLAV